nr:hypothetical protein [Tanacetum cinerariifolium]
MESQSETTQTVSALKVPVLKTREYDLWSIRMEQYLTFTDHALWEVIVNGDSVSSVASAGAEVPIPPKTAKQKLSLWEAIKNKFGGNKELKKMQMTILRQNYENFAASSQEGLYKTYDRFQKLISQLEIYGEVISQEDANLKLLKSLPSACNNIALIMRNKSDLDTLIMEDLYNNLKGNRNRDAPTRNAPVDTSTTNSLVVQDGIGSSSSPNSDSKVHTCSKESLKSYEALQKQYDQQREALNKSNLKIIGYQMGLKSLEARIVVHEKNEVVYKEDVAFLKYDVQSEVLNNVFDSHESDVDDNQVNDRFKKVKRYHPVPPTYTGNYMPLRADLSFAGLDNSVFKSKVSETITSVPKIKTNASKTSKDSLEKPKTVRSSALLIEDWKSDSEDENVFKPKKVKKIVKPSLKKIEFVKARNTTVENKNKSKNLGSSVRVLGPSVRLKIFGPTYVNLGDSIPINVATLPNAYLPTDPLMPDLEDTGDHQDTRIFSSAYDDEVEAFGYIPLMKTKLLIKKLKDSKGEHQVYRRIVGIKRLHDDIRITTAQVTTIFNKVNDASLRVTTADRVTTAGWIKTEIA